MATSDGPPNVPNVTLTLAVARAAQVSSGELLFKDNFSDYETDPLAWDNIQMDKVTGSPNYDRLLAKGIRCSNSIRCTPRQISDIAGPSAPQHLITEDVSAVANPKIESDSTGTALRFRMNSFPINSGSQSLAEFRWNLDPGAFFPQGEGTTRLLTQYDLYVPENFHLRDTSLGSDLSGYLIEQKFITLYAGGYSGEHPTLFVGGGASFSDYGMPAENTMYVNLQTKKSVADGLDVWGGRDLGETLPVIYPDDRGHWLRLTTDMQLESAAGANDGIFKLFVQRRVGEPDTYVDMIFDENAMDSHYDETYRFLDGGYILGNSNIGYDEDVNFLVDNLIITDDPANVDQTAIQPSQPPQSRLRTTVTNAGTGETANARRPGGMVDGDTVVMVISGSANFLIADANLIDGGNSGFTQIYSTRDWDSGARDNICAVYVKKVADVLSEPFWYAVDFTGITGGFSVILLTASGRGDVVNNTLVQETIPPESSSQNSPISIDLAGVTAREGDDLIWIGVAVMDGATTDGLTQDSFSFPAGMTPEHKALGNWSSGGVAVQRNVSAGDTGILSGSFNLINNTTATGVPRGVVIALPKEAV